MKVKCYFCGEEKECTETIIYQKGEYKKVYICEECLIKRYGEEKKLEQLKTIFRAMVKDIIKKTKLGQKYFETEEHINTIVESLIYEVKIRIKGVE